MESFQVLNLCHRINNWLLKAMETAYIGPTDILLNTTRRLCSQDFFCSATLQLHNSCPSWDEKLNLWAHAFQNAIFRGHMHVAVTQKGSEAPLSFRDQPTNQWQHHGQCLLCAEEQQVLSQTRQGQDMAGSTLAASSAWQRQMLWLSNVGCKGQCLPNYTKQHMLFTAPTTSCKNTKRGIMMTHEKQKSHNFQKLVNHQLQAPVPTAWNALWLTGIFQVHQEQPLSLSRLFC